MGLHTIDTVRRDAAEQHIQYETRYRRTSGRAEITLSCEQVRLDYSIDVKTDVVEAISISRTDGGRGELRFSYLQDIDTVGTEFARPSARGPEVRGREGVAARGHGAGYFLFGNTRTDCRRRRSPVPGAANGLGDSAADRLLRGAAPRHQAGMKQTGGMSDRQ